MGATEVCTDYQQAYTPSTAQLACSGIYSTAACPTANRVGRCAVSVTVLGSTASTTLSYYAPTTTDIAMLACTSAGGTFRSN